MAKRKTRKIGIEDLFRLRTITGADLSPDGETIAFAVGRHDLAKNGTFSSLYAVPARGGRLRRLTRGEHVDGSPKFSPDGRVLGFLSDRDDVRSLWVLPLDGGEPERITDRDRSVSDYAFSPDGKRVAYTARRLTEREALERDGKKDEAAKLPHYRHVTRLAYRTDGVGFRTGEDTHVWLKKVAGGKARCLTEGVAADHAEPRFSPDGARVSFVSNRLDDPDRFAEHSDIYTVETDGTGLRKVTREDGPSVSHAWSPDGESIWFLGYEGGPGEWNRHHVHVRRVAAGGGPSTDLTPDLDANAMNSVIGDTAAASFSGPAPVPSADGSRVFFAATREGACHLGSVPAEGGEISWLLVGDVSVMDFGGAGDGAPAYAVLSDLLNPADLHALRATGSPKRITKLNDRVLSGLDLAEPEEVRFERKGGKVHGWVLKPPRFRRGVTYPVVLNVHGGPHVCYGHVFFHEMQLLAARGYVVLMTNPRGSDGYGLDHRMAIHGAYGTVDAEDLTTALDALLEEEWADPERLFVTGGSYGGYMTNWLVSHSDRFRAAVTQRSVTDFRSFFGSSDIGYRFPTNELGGLPWDIPEVYTEQSPITHAREIRTPLLILHSESDLRCPIEQAEQLFTVLKMLDREVEMVRFVGESHGLSRGGRPQNRAERLRRILDWFGAHGGK